MMIPVITKLEQSGLDQAAAKHSSGFEYMQRAARGLFDLIINRYLELQKQGKSIMITIFAGAGNNGGDGLLLATYLLEEGYPVKVFATGSAAQYQNEAKQALAELERQKQNLNFISDVADLEFVQQHFASIAGKYTNHIFVDALLGFGASGTTREPHASLIRFINENFNNAEIIAVDLPSGTDADSGKLNGTAVRAHKTLSMGFPKLGSFFFPARANYGLTVVQNLSYPQEIFEQEFKSQIYFINTVKELMSPRIATGSKYDHGYAVLVAGSPGMEGAAKLASRAAYRSGLGLLKLITDSETRKICATSLDEAISDVISDDLLKQLGAKLPVVLALGPGLGQAYTKQIKSLLEASSIPLILDADGLNSIKPEDLKKSKAEILITPHAGEHLRLFGEINSEPLELIRTLQLQAKQTQVNILYKGAPTIIADKSGKVFIVPFGNSGLATAGTGDVLTGLILGLAAQLYAVQAKFPNLRFFHQAQEISILTQAAITASYLHGKAAETAAKELSEHSLIASDLIEFLPDVIINEVLTSRKHSSG